MDCHQNWLVSGSWIGIGWVVAFIWSLTGNTKRNFMLLQPAKPVEPVKAAKPAAPIAKPRFFLKAAGIAAMGIVALNVVAMYMYIRANPEAPDVSQYWDAVADLNTAWVGLVETVLYQISR